MDITMDQHVRSLQSQLSNILAGAKDLIISKLESSTYGGEGVFPSQCSTNEYGITEEKDGSIWIPTLFSTDGKRIFVKLEASLEIEP